MLVYLIPGAQCRACEELRVESIECSDWSSSCNGGMARYLLADVAFHSLSERGVACISVRVSFEQGPAPPQIICTRTGTIGTLSTGSGVLETNINLGGGQSLHAKGLWLLAVALFFFVGVGAFMVIARKLRILADVALALVLAIEIAALFTLGLLVLAFVRRDEAGQLAHVVEAVRSAWHRQGTVAELRCRRQAYRDTLDAERELAPTCQRSDRAAQNLRGGVGARALGGMRVEEMRGQLDVSRASGVNRVCAWVPMLTALGQGDRQ